MPVKEGLVNLKPALQFYGFNVMSVTTFSTWYSESQRPEVDRLMQLLEGAQEPLGVLGHVPWVVLIMELIPGLLHSIPEFHHEAQRLLDRRLMVG